MTNASWRGAATRAVAAGQNRSIADPIAQIMPPKPRTKISTAMAAPRSAAACGLAARGGRGGVSSAIALV